MPPPDSRSTGEAPADLDNVRLNNRLRGAIDAALGGLTLLANNPGARYEAAQAVFKSRAASALPTLETAIAKEQRPADQARAVGGARRGHSVRRQGQR